MKRTRYTARQQAALYFARKRRRYYARIAAGGPNMAGEIVENKDPGSLNVQVKADKKPSGG
jgi:hypothetical protein